MNNTDDNNGDREIILAKILLATAIINLIGDTINKIFELIMKLIE